MNFKFKIGDTTLDLNETKALLGAAGREATFVVDIADHVDPTMIDAKKLFSMSVETKNPTLASLAARFAIEGVQTPKKRRYNRDDSQRLSNLTVTKSVENPAEAIEELNQMGGIRTIGAAMILDSLKDGQTRTLRQIATSCVNTLAYKGEVSADSQCFKGFIQDGDGHYRALHQSTNIPRSATYHASPMYTALRDGAALLKEWGLIEMKEVVEFGSENKKLNSASKLLRRTVYTVKSTSMGRKVAEEWGDINDYITHQWSRRVRERKMYAA